MRRSHLTYVLLGDAARQDAKMLAELTSLLGMRSVNGRRRTVLTVLLQAAKKNITIERAEVGGSREWQLRPIHG